MKAFSMVKLVIVLNSIYDIAVLSFLCSNFHHGKFKRPTSKLDLDIFGLGPPEVAIMVAAAALLYGPDRVKIQLGKNGAKGVVVSKGWQADHAARVDEMRKYAVSVRTERALSRLAQAIAEENLYVVDKMDEYQQKTQADI